MSRSGDSRGTNELQNTADKENDKNRAGTKVGSNSDNGHQPCDKEQVVNLSETRCPHCKRPLGW